MKTIELEGVGVERAFKVMRVLRDEAGLNGKRFPLEIEVRVTGEMMDLETGTIVEVEGLEIIGFLRKQGRLGVEVFVERSMTDIDSYLLVPADGGADWSIACSAIN